MLRSMKQVLTFSETASNAIQALGADVITAHVVSTVSTGGIVKMHLQGTMDERPVASQVWYDLGTDVTIHTSTYTIITHLPNDTSVGGKPGCFRNYRLSMSAWGGVWIKCEIWLTGQGHESSDTPNTPLE